MTVIKSYLMDLEAVAKLKQDLEKTIEDLLIDYKPDEQHNLLEERRKLDEQRKTFSDRILQLDRVKVELEQYLSLSKYIESEKVKYNELNLLLEQKNKVLADAQSSFENKNAEYQLLKPSQISFPKFDSFLFAMSCELSLIAHCPQLKIFLKYIN